MICLAISTVLLLVGLWPFNFFPDNNVRWIAGRNGLRFDRYGMAYGRDPVFVPGGGIDLANPWTLFLEAKPFEEQADSLPRLLSLYDIDGTELLLIGQWRSELIIRILEGKRHWRLKYREIGIGNFRRNATQTFAICRDNTGVTLYSGGRSVTTPIGSPLPVLATHRAPAYLILGNSPTGEHPWRGDILALSFFPRALRSDEIGKVSSFFESEEIPKFPGEKAPMILYRFSEGSGAICRSGPGPGHDLVIPAVFRAPKKGVLVPPWKVERYDRPFWKDVAVNVLGFIPFGLAMSAWLWTDDEKKRRTSTVTAVFLGGAISLAIELLQTYLPTRDSSLTDVIDNVLGTWIGVLLFRTARGHLHR